MPKYQVQVYNCYSLHVRAAGRVSAKVIQWVQKGEKYTSSKQASNGWMYLDEKKGWSNGKYLKKLKRLDKPTTSKKTEKPKTQTQKPQDPKPANVNKIATAAMTQYTTSSTGLSDYRASRAVALEETTFDYMGAYIPPDPPETAVVTDPQADPTPAGSSGDPVGTRGDYNASAMSIQPMSYNMRQVAVADSNTLRAAATAVTTKTAEAVVLHDYTINTAFLEDKMETIRRNLNIRPVDDYGSLYTELSENFNRFKINFPTYFAGKTFGHVFFTRPDIQFYLNDGTALRPAIADDMVFKGIHTMNPKLLKSLTRHFTADHGFQPFLSNTAASFEVPDEFIKTMEHGETMVGHKVQYGRNNIEANNAGTFNVNYTDDKYLSIYQIHKAWIDYISKVSRGEIDLKYTPYRANKVLDYTCSVYYILCAADNETVLFWTKYFGVFPTNTASSSASWTKGSPVRNPDINIQYAYSMKEDLNVLSLAEFNALSSTSGKTNYEPIYASAKDENGNLVGMGTVGRTMVGAPFIERKKNKVRTYYKLRFRNRKG